MLDPLTARVIRRLLQSSLTIGEIMEVFSVSPRTIWEIKAELRASHRPHFDECLPEERENLRLR